MDKKIYMDYSATTYTKPEVLKEMLPYFTENYGNPSSLYTLSNLNRKAINEARTRVANAINAEVDEICFTSGGDRKSVV